MDVGRDLMAGLAQGIQQHAILPAAAMMSTTRNLVAAPAMAGAGANGNTVHMNFNTTISNGMDERNFEQRVVRSVKRSIRA
jgi:hypothetical protein